MLADILDERIAHQHQVLEAFGFSCLVKSHYGSVTAKSGDELFDCACEACEAEAEMRVFLQERKKFL